MRKFLLIGAVGMIAMGCSLGRGFVDSFKTQPGQRPMTLPHREQVGMSTMTVSVQLMDGNHRPYCMLPMADNDIACTFRYGWFENGGLVMQGPDGYRFLSFDTAQQACREALWSVGGQGNQNNVVNACARALLAFRWMDDAGRYEGEE
jgi:hypothetical protein